MQEGRDILDKVLRQEKKFLISQAEFRRFSAYLENFMISDPHNGADGYLIRSLYFDSINDRDFDEKEQGTLLRRKIRLRNYGGNFPYAKLEMKQKQGADQLKRSLTVPKADGIRLVEGDYSVLLNYEEPFAGECFAMMNMYCYRPKTVVQYNRKAYIAKENKIRITFDNNIVANEANYNIFDDNLPLYPVFDKYNVVLEVKYNGFLLSYIKDLLAMVDRSELSVGKYSLARGVSMHYSF